MRNKNISTQSYELLSYFNRLDQSCFTNAEAFQALPHSKETAVTQLLSDMAKRGLLMRIKDGLYYIIPFEKEPEYFMPDWHQLAGYLVKGERHYIGYYSALQVHGLITQPSLKEQIVVAKQIKPSSFSVKDVTFQFIYHNEDHFFGFKKFWIDDYHKVFCSDYEKTIIDCLFKPEYAGGIVEIGKAIHQLKDKLDYEKLYEYVHRFNSQAVIKRLGFLLELLEIANPIIEKLQTQKSSSYVILDTELPREGRHWNRWNIQINIEPETIKSAIYT